MKCLQDKKHECSVKNNEDGNLCVLCNYNPHEMKYPWVGIELTQAPDRYEVYVGVSKNVNFSVTIDPEGLKYIKDQIDRIYEHEEWRKK